MMAALLAAGCASVPETRFYTLSVPPGSSETKITSRDSSTPIFIDVLPVNVPERLARPQLVVRSAGAGPETQLFILEQDRWSSPFNYELRDAFVTGIANQTGAVNEARGTYAPDQPGYRIAIELGQFDAIVGDRVQARFGWT
ncbi:MAG: membrane integrity-associated transporter subunit PqiC, partial [Betaproteobacteria bacterium]|nr:membrane integrity-associated transporter subunit PqiC [Betaproteobacteria bacterium]